MQMADTYEGYMDNGRFYPTDETVQIKGRCKVLVTVLSIIEPNADTWAELDLIVSEMTEKPDIADFPRCDLGRELVTFEEA